MYETCFINVSALPIKRCISQIPVFAGLHDDMDFFPDDGRVTGVTKGNSNEWNRREPHLQDLAFEWRAAGSDNGNETGNMRGRA